MNELLQQWLIGFIYGSVGTILLSTLIGLVLVRISHRTFKSNIEGEWTEGNIIDDV